MDLNKYLESGEYLPSFLRDFNDQKDFFKSLHYLYRNDKSVAEKPNWRDGQIYAIDWFLWFAASRGYTLQKCRKKNVDFKDIPDWGELNPYKSIPGVFPSIDD